jgi:hypothetical protein
VFCFGWWGTLWHRDAERMAASGSVLWVFFCMFISLVARVREPAIVVKAVVSKTVLGTNGPPFSTHVSALQSLKHLRLGSVHQLCGYASAMLNFFFFARSQILRGARIAGGDETKRGGVETNWGCSERVSRVREP